jgi:hypothetical protein
VPTWLTTTRTGPLTGAAEQEPRPLQDTTMWGVHGVDEGVSVIFQDRTYIYFGDVAPNPQDPDYQSRLNLDLIAWTSEPHVHTHGGHLARGWTFYLPNSSQQSGPAPTQQPNCGTASNASRCSIVRAEKRVLAGARMTTVSTTSPVPSFTCPI